MKNQDASRDESSRQQGGNGVSRRDVLGSSSALAAGALLASVPGARKQAPTSSRGSGGNRDVLVQIFLRGAMDGLTTVVPHGEAAYYSMRPNLAVPQPGQTDGAIDLDGFFGLAPSAAPLLTPWNNGHLAVVHAAGSTDPTRSHFEAFRRMEFGTPNMPLAPITDGWLARYLVQKQADATSILRAIGANDILPQTLAGAPNTIPVPDMANFFFPGFVPTAQERANRIGKMYSRVPAPVGPTATNTLASIELLATVDFVGYAPAGGAAYPDSILGTQLRNTAALIKAEKGVEAITIDYGGWDHHVSMGPLDGTLAGMLADLSQSLEAFYLDMLGRIDEVVVVILSEFGRRVDENSSLGCDHGRGNVMLALGGGIQGGQIITSWPGLQAHQLQDGAVQVTTDYRDILGEILVNRLAATDLTEIFPGHGFTTHGITV